MWNNSTPSFRACVNIASLLTYSLIDLRQMSTKKTLQLFRNGSRLFRHFVHHYCERSAREITWYQTAVRFNVGNDQPTNRHRIGRDNKYHFGTCDAQPRRTCKQRYVTKSWSFAVHFGHKSMLYNRKWRRISSSDLPVLVLERFSHRLRGSLLHTKYNNIAVAYTTRN